MNFNRFAVGLFATLGLTTMLPEWLYEYDIVDRILQLPSLAPLILTALLFALLASPRPTGLMDCYVRGLTGFALALSSTNLPPRQVIPAIIAGLAVRLSSGESHGRPTP